MYHHDDPMLAQESKRMEALHKANPDRDWKYGMTPEHIKQIEAERKAKSL
jgi:hypothetical protein